MTTGNDEVQVNTYPDGSREIITPIDGNLTVIYQLANGVTFMEVFGDGYSYICEVKPDGGKRTYIKYEDSRTSVEIIEHPNGTKSEETTLFEPIGVDANGNVQYVSYASMRVVTWDDGSKAVFYNNSKDGLDYIADYDVAGVITHALSEVDFRS